MHDANLHQAIQKQLRGMSPVDDWPELAELIDRAVTARSRPCWEYPGAACTAVGGQAQAALPGAAAIFCLLASIYLVDDLLDEDPKGLYHQVGHGKAANIALAFQAMAGLVIEEADLSELARADVQGCVAKIAMDTAYGQDLDTREICGEADYWRAVATKTPPLFGGALEIGAILGGAPEYRRVLLELGVMIGKLVQVSDDLKDALETPAHPDWKSRNNNLALLFALTAEHPYRGRFEALVPQVFDSSEALHEAQELLVHCGAASYCTYQIVETFKAAKAHLQEAKLPSPEPLVEILEAHIRPARTLIESVAGPEASALL